MTFNVERKTLNVLYAHILGKPRAWVLAHPEAALSAEQQRNLDLALARLQAGISLPYILGHWEFYGLDYNITPDVLIPRPETELLVETALSEKSWQTPGSRALDVGTGSGCIAISLAVHAPRAYITASDISPAALAIARANARKHHVQIEFVESDLFNSLNPSTGSGQAVERLKACPEPVDGFNVICANLPYIPTKTLHKLEVFGREPTLALDGGVDGLQFVRRLLADAPPFLAPEGILLCEIEASQGKPAQALAWQYFPDADICVKRDLAGQERLLIVKR